MPDFLSEAAAIDRGRLHICGVDEVGRGPLAGPVVAAAVILPLDDHGRPALSTSLLARLDDSKKLSASARTTLHDLLIEQVDFGVGYASATQIDRINILQASFAAMRRAIAGLRQPPDHALVDGNRLPPGLPCSAEPLVRGDGRSLSIAAASIIAKVIRDRLMARLELRHPGYGWARNAGYGTAEHREAIGRLGLTRYHRRSFGGCREHG